MFINLINNISLFAILKIGNGAINKYNFTMS